MHQISPFSLSERRRPDLSGCQLSALSYVLGNRFFFPSFPAPEANGVWHGTNTIPDKDVSRDAADKYSPVWSSSYDGSALLSVPTRPPGNYTTSCLEFSSHDRWNVRAPPLIRS